jgi:hypothetical protein
LFLFFLFLAFVGTQTKPTEDYTPQFVATTLFGCWYARLTGEPPLEPGDAEKLFPRESVRQPGYLALLVFAFP